ncbi:cytochrome c biogenesis protein CcsA [Sporosarcina thermotolerans]|uniref:Cytochrome c biogenesis protein CcsA n=1 Tax=Sporosarcina thermotolerans TaxID=633404 RepID=A0AAW9ADI9_9BACL|nr:cytochrome c biogenesis protein CcsA [Sporosarcina thermotolerans]MDW0118120.1 cytochrome c biogenesis protein CcsA [Sporosarcina thermotolerans]WHT47614.1 cytochrome c biogenesis protein CcsA [Sporosarcina thermotolerans]
MAEMTMARFHEIIIILYAVSLVFYFIDYLNTNKFAHRSAFWILSLVYIMQTGFLIATVLEKKQFPILSLYEGIYFYAWLLISLSMVLQVFSKVGFAVFFLNVIGFIFMSIYAFAPMQIEQSPIGESLLSELLFIHITFAILSYAAFAMSLVSAILYLLVYKLLKEKKWTKQFGRLPSLHQTLTGMKVSIYTGIPVLLVSLILGIQWAFVALDDWLLTDMKIIGSFLIIILYSLVLFLQRRGKLTANDFAWANVFAFLFVIINFFLGSRLSQFHFWI